MRRQYFILGLLLSAIPLITACSGGAGTVIPDVPSVQTGAALYQPAGIQSPAPGRYLWGCYKFTFDPANMTIEVVPIRDADIHYNITNMLKPPACSDCLSIEVVDFQQANHYVKLKLVLKNPTLLTGYDVRGIVVSNAQGLIVLNADSYTDLWDDEGDITINPFKAFATDQPKRKFAPKSSHARIYELKYQLFKDLANAAVIVDASWPDNCKEPYAIADFIQSKPLYAYGGTASIKMNIYDWQFDAEEVYIDATPIGGGIVKLEYKDGVEWDGVIDTTQENPEGEYRLLAYAGSANTPIKLYNYFNIDVALCFAEGNETWQNATNLPPGSDSGIQVVCLDDKIDWYMFTIPTNPVGDITLKVLDDNGTCDLTLYNDPEAKYLLWGEASYGNDKVFLVDPLELPPGTYYLRVRHIGNAAVNRRYQLKNNILNPECQPEGNETWENATNLPIGQNSGFQVVCLDDKIDWFNFFVTDDIWGKIILSLVNNTGPCDITFYNNPESDYLLWKEVTGGSDAILDIEPLGLGAGTYYLRVRYLGSDQYERQYTLQNNVSYFPCKPEGNETWETASELPAGNNSGEQEVCLWDKIDWYKFTVTLPITGTLELELLNNTGSSDIAFYNNPDGSYPLWKEATYGNNAVLDIGPLEPGPGTYYIRVRHIGSDLEVRNYTLWNKTKVDTCLPEGNESWQNATYLNCGNNTGFQEVCSTDKSDWYWFLIQDQLSGDLRLNLLNDTGSCKLSFYAAPNDPPLLQDNAEFGADAVLDVTPLSLGAGSYYMLVEHVGSDYKTREYTLFNNCLDSICYLDGNNSPDTALLVPPGVSSSVDYVCNYDKQDWFYFNAYSQLKGSLTLTLLNSTGMADITLYNSDQSSDPDGPYMGWKQTSSEVTIDLDALGAGPDTYYIRVRHIGSDDDYREFLVTNDFVPSGWAYGWDNAYAYCDVDNSGNVYIAGTFTDAVDFDPSPGTDFHSGDDSIFICKLSSQGEYLGGVFFAQSCEVHDIKVDQDNNIYIGGILMETGSPVDFDPGPGINTHISNGGNDALLCKFDPDLNLDWALTWGSTHDDDLRGISIDNSGNVYVCGDAGWVIDLDPGPGVDEHTPVYSEDFFVMMLQEDGNYQWGFLIGGEGRDFAKGIIADNLGSLYVTGDFEQQVDFDPGLGEDWHIAVNHDGAFISKFSTLGEFKWARTWGKGINPDAYSEGLTMDHAGSLYVIGWFEGNLDFDPSDGVDYHAATGNSDAYLCKYNSDGDYLWAQTWGGGWPSSQYYGFSVAVDSSDNVYVGSGKTSMRLQQYTPSGDQVWERSWDATGNEEPMDITINDSNEIFFSGYFHNTMDFDPGPGIYEVYADGDDTAFLCKILPSGYW